MSVSGPLPEASSTEAFGNSVQMTASYFGRPAAVFLEGSVSGVTADGEQSVTYWFGDVRVGRDRFRMN